MRKSSWTPSIVPTVPDQTVYLVIDKLDPVATVYRETEVGQADLETIIRELEAGQYVNLLCVIAVNTLEGRSGDVSKDVARELQRRADGRFEDPSSRVQKFIDQHLGETRQLSLRLNNGR